MLKMSRTLGFATGLLAAVAGTQLPEFAQQYRQRLGGAIDELRSVMQRFDADAAAAGVDRSQAMQRLTESSDAFTSHHGSSMGEAAVRLERMEAQQRAFAEAGPLQRLVVFAHATDPILVANTWRDFEPATPVTVESFTIGGLAFFLGYGLIRALATPFHRLSRRRRLRAEGRMRA
jgi:outer membrane murein-binding lipoprotein Lpp